MQADGSYPSHYRGPKSEAVSTVIIWGIAVDLGANDGEQLADHEHCRYRSRPARVRTHVAKH